MMALLEALLSNAIVVIVPALLAVVAVRSRRHPALVRSLWLLVFAKLVTPPIIALPCLPWSQAGAPSAPQVEAKAELRMAAEEERHPAIDTIVEWTDGDDDEVTGSTFTAERPWGFAAGPPTASAEPSRAARSRTARFWSSPTIVAMAIGLWSFGTAICLGVSLWRMFRFGQVLKLSAPATPPLQRRVHRLATRIGLRRTPTICVLPGAPTPMVWVPWRAYLVIPARQVDELHADQLDALILHELAHLRNGDHWVRWLEMLATFIYWWHPVIWYARRGIREVEEQMCDARVIETLPAVRTVYAETLIDIVTQFSGQRLSLPPAASGLSQFHLVKRRITMIMQDNISPRLSAGGWLVVIAVSTLLIPVAPTLARPEPQVQDGSIPADVEPVKPTFDSVAMTAPVPDEPIEVSPVEPALTALAVRLAKLDRDDRGDRRDQDEEEDGEDRHSEEADEAEEAVAEIIDEMREAIAEMDDEVREAIEEATEELQEFVKEAPKSVQRELLEVDIDAIIREAVSEAPRPVRMFVEEVDPAHVIETQLDELDLQEMESDEDLRDRVERKLTRFLREHIGAMSRETQKEIRNIQQEITRETRRAPAVIQQVLADVDFDEALSEVITRSSPIVQRIVEDVHVEEMVRVGISGGREGRTGRDDEDRSRRRTEREQRERVTESRSRREEHRRAGDEDRMEQLERRLERLLREAHEIVEQLEELRDEQRGSRSDRRQR